MQTCAPSGSEVSDFEQSTDTNSKNHHRFINTKVLLTLFNGEPVWGAMNFEKVPTTTDTVGFGDYSNLPRTLSTLSRTGFRLFHSLIEFDNKPVLSYSLVSHPLSELLPIDLSMLMFCNQRRLFQ